MLEQEQESLRRQEEEVRNSIASLEAHVSTKDKARATMQPMNNQGYLQRVEDIFYSDLSKAQLQGKKSQVRSLWCYVFLSKIE